MQLLADFFPLILFFLAFKWQGIMFATGVAIVASVVQIAWLYSIRKLSPIPLISFAIIVVFGGATLLLKDDTFIKWKPTVLYGLFALVLAFGKLVLGRDLLQYVMKGIDMPAHVWTRLTWAWACFFALMAVTNWYVAFHYTTETWVDFKVWGAMGLCIVFALAQAVFLMRYMNDERPSQS
jgi:intracellular septation protein